MISGVCTKMAAEGSVLLWTPSSPVMISHRWLCHYFDVEDFPSYCTENDC